MALDDLRTRLELLLAAMVNQPEDDHQLALRIREMIAEFRAEGLPVPDDLARLEVELDAGEGAGPA